MKKYVVSILALVMALAMMFSLVGCDLFSKDDDKDDDDKKPKASAVDKEDEEEEVNYDVVGEWEAKVDISDMVIEEIESTPEMEEFLEYVDFDTMNMVFNLTFDEDGTYEIEFDQSSIDDIADTMLDNILDGAVEFLKVELEKEDIDFDEFLEESDMTVSDVKEMLLDEMGITADDIKDMMGELEFEETGEYELDGKILEIDGDEVEFDGNKIIVESEGIEFVFKRA